MKEMGAEMCGWMMGCEEVWVQICIYLGNGVFLGVFLDKEGKKRSFLPSGQLF